MNVHAQDPCILLYIDIHEWFIVYVAHVGKYTDLWGPMGNTLKALISTTHHFKKGVLHRRFLSDPNGELFPVPAGNFPASYC